MSYPGVDIKQAFRGCNSEKGRPTTTLGASTMPRSKLLPKNTSKSGRGMKNGFYFMVIYSSTLVIATWNTAKKDSATTFRVGREE